MTGSAARAASASPSCPPWATCTPATSRCWRRARRRADRVALSIFVNPTQFGPNEDLARYPRDLDGDLAHGRRAPAPTSAFVPRRPHMYPPGFQTFVRGARAVARGCAAIAAPVTSSGWPRWCAKLFNIVRPHLAVFGEKDFQQLAVVRRMVADLDLGVEIVGLPTVREPDGLAMSSRNRYLSPPDRKRALALYRALTAARQAAADGETAGGAAGTGQGDHRPRGRSLDYLEIRDTETLAPLDRVDRPGVMLVAAFVGTTRLIDNVRL